MTRQTSPTHLASLVFAASLLLYLSVTGGSLSSTDAVVTFDLTESLVTRRSIALSGNLLGLEPNRGLDGRYYSQYGIGKSIYDIPFYAAGRLLHRAVPARVGKPDSLVKAAVGVSSAVAAAATVAVVFLLAHAVFGRRTTALYVAALVATGSLLFPYAKFGFNAPLAAVLLTTTALLLWRGVHEQRRDLLLWAGAAAGAGWLTRHEFPLLILPLALWLAVTPDRRGAVRRLVAFAPGVVAGGALWMWYNAVRFGRPLFVGYTPAYTGDGFSGLLLSPSGSVALYWPAIALCVWGLLVMRRSDRASVRLLVWPAIVLFCYVGLLRDWPGGRSYGPRYLVPILPLLAVGAGALFESAQTRGRRWLGAALLAATVAQLPGVLVDYSRVSQAWAQGAAPGDLAGRLHLWEAAPIVLNTKAAITAVPRNLAYVTGRATPPAVQREGTADDRSFAQQFAFSLDFWWLYAFYLGVVPAAVAVLIGTVLWGGAIALAVLAWRLAGRADAAVEPGA